MKNLLAVTLVTLGLGSQIQAAEMTSTTTVLSGNFASDLAQQAMTICQDQGYAVSAAVVDRSGNLLALARHESASPHTINSASQKAFTSASMGRDTKALAKLIVDQPMLAGLADMDDRMIMLEGGLPVSVNDVRVAGIGVGGAPGGHLDAACAQQAMDKLMK